MSTSQAIRIAAAELYREFPEPMKKTSAPIIRVKEQSKGHWVWSVSMVNPNSPTGETLFDDGLCFDEWNANKKAEESAIRLGFNPADWM